MTQKDLAACHQLVAGFREAAAIQTLSPEMRGEFDGLARSASMLSFPGVVLAWPRPGMCSVYYAVAWDVVQWRRLRPLLTAFVGPTVTSFDGLPAVLTPKYPVERYLLSLPGCITARIVPGPEPKHRQMASRALERLLTTVGQAPSTSAAIPHTTSQLLAGFVDCLNGNDRLGAEVLLDTCCNELRVDALNQSFLRIRLLSHFSDWPGIVALPEFMSLCHTRKPPAVTVALLEALWQVYLAPFEGTESFDRLRARWLADVRSRALLMLHTPISSDCSPGVRRLFAWQAITERAFSPELKTALLPYLGELGEIGSHLEAIFATQVSLDCEAVSAEATGARSGGDLVSRAQHALAVAGDLNTLATISEALARVAQLSEQERETLLRSELFRSTWREVQREVGNVLPPDWEAWLACLPDPSFTATSSVLERAVMEWPASMLVDTMDIERLAKALISVPDGPPADGRLADSLPHLVAWVARDTSFPRPAMAPVYDALLFHLLLGARRGTAVFDSAAVLFRAMLAIGLTPSRYTTLLDDCLALIGEGIGVRNVYWLLDILEETFLNQAPDQQARENFACLVQSRLAPLYPHLTPGQKLSLQAFSGLFPGTSTVDGHTDTPSVVPEKMNSLATVLHSRTVGIYSLTESAAKQAAQVLKRLDSSIKVLLSHDGVGTPMLRSMAQTVDLMVVATASAKHAATGFIQQVRPREKPTVFASGRGFSSIIRSIEEHYLSKI